MNERSSVHGEDDRTCRPSLYAKSARAGIARSTQPSVWPKRCPSDIVRAICQARSTIVGTRGCEIVEIDRAAKAAQQKGNPRGLTSQKTTALPRNLARAQRSRCHYR